MLVAVPTHLVLRNSKTAPRVTVRHRRGQPSLAAGLTRCQSSADVKRRAVREFASARRSWEDILARHSTETLNLGEIHRVLRAGGRPHWLYSHYGTVQLTKQRPRLAGISVTLIRDDTDGHPGPDASLLDSARLESGFDHVINGDAEGNTTTRQW
jgi:hypothetical protein